jgi:hypothetical protein
MEGRTPSAPLGRMDATSNRSDSAGIDWPLRLPTAEPVNAKMPNNTSSVLRPIERLELGVLIYLRLVDVRQIFVAVHRIGMIAKSR